MCMQHAHTDAGVCVQCIRVTPARYSNRRRGKPGGCRRRSGGKDGSESWGKKMVSGCSKNHRWRSTWPPRFCLARRRNCVDPNRKLAEIILASSCSGHRLAPPPCHHHLAPPPCPTSFTNSSPLSLGFVRRSCPVRIRCRQYARACLLQSHRLSAQHTEGVSLSSLSAAAAVASTATSSSLRAKDKTLTIVLYDDDCQLDCDVRAAMKRGYPSKVHGIILLLLLLLLLHVVVLVVLLVAVQSGGRIVRRLVRKER